MAARNSCPHEIKEIDGVEYVLVPKQKWDDLGTYFEIALEEKMEQARISFIDTDKKGAYDDDASEVHFFHWLVMLSLLVLAAGWIPNGWDSKLWVMNGRAWCAAVTSCTILWSLVGLWVDWWMAPRWVFLRYLLRVVFEAPAWIWIAVLLNYFLHIISWLQERVLMLFGPL